MKRACTIHSLEELQSFAKELLPQLRSPTILLLSGPMGTGKTSLVKALVQAMGLVPQSVHSPSFALHHHYQTPWGPVDHLDLFRLQSTEEVDQIGLWEQFQRQSGMVIIEWPELIPQELWPRNWNLVRIDLQLLQPDQDNSPRLLKLEL